MLTMSCGLPQRPSGTRRAIRSRAERLIPAGGNIGPGAMAFTWMAGANSFASALVSPRTPALETQ